MATQALRTPLPVRRDAPVQKPATKAPEKSAVKTTDRSLLQRLFDFIVESQSRRAEREIERYMLGRGTRLTDEVERDIERRFLGTPPKL